MNDTAAATRASSWKRLYTFAGVSTLIAVVFFRRNFAAEIDVTNGFGIFNMPEAIPVSASDWFALFQADRYLALGLFGVADLINYLLIALLFLALYGALKQVNRSASLVGLITYMVGMGVYIASNQAFAMLVLSDRYTAAVGEPQRAIYLAAGEALLAIENPGSIYQGTGVYLSLLLVLVAGLIFSIMMLRSDDFNNATAVVGILANGLGMCSFITLVFAPDIQWLFPSLSAPFRLIWYIMITIGLFKLGRRD